MMWLKISTILWTLYLFTWAFGDYDDIDYFQNICQHNYLFEPGCTNVVVQNITMKPDHAKIALDSINEIRANIAMGHLTGENDVLLPRGYGLHKLKWNNKLATTAQESASDCQLLLNLCKETRKTSYPGQTITMTLFTLGDWLPIQHMDLFKTKGLSDEKVRYAIVKSIFYLYSQKVFVNEEIVKRVPDWLTFPNGQGFVQIAYGRATEIGCGVSAFENTLQLENPYNAIVLVCNILNKPQPGSALYRTSNNYSETICENANCIDEQHSRCGCPQGTIEHSNCLCEDPFNSLGLSSSGEEKIQQRTPSSNILSPTIAVDYVSAMRSYEGHPNQRRTRSYMMSTGRLPYKQGVAVIPEKIRRVDNPWKKNGYHILPVKKPGEHRRKNFVKPGVHKPSIFARAQKFHLKSLVQVDKKNNMMKPKIPNVVPRKDFSKAKNALETYLKVRRDNDKTDPVKTFHEDHPFDSPIIGENPIESTPNPIPGFENSVESHTGVLSQNKVLRWSKSDANEEQQNKDHTQEEEILRDKKILSLISTLEEELYNAQLTPEEKEIIDSKITNIYNSLVGEHSQTKKETVHDDSEHHSCNEEKDDYMRDLCLRRNKKRKEHHVERTNEHSDVSAEELHLNSNKNINHHESHSRSRFENYGSDLENPKQLSLETDMTDAEPQKHRNTISIQKTHYKLPPLKEYDKNIEQRKKIYDRFNYEIPKQIEFSDSEWDYEEDLLGMDRRKFYQDKLDELKKKVNRRNSELQHFISFIRQPMRSRERMEKIRSSRGHERHHHYNNPDRSKIHRF